MKGSPTVAFHTLGCKLNFAESSSIARQLKGEGFQKVEFEQHADMYVINTCSVTENADRECRMIVRRALSANPEAFIAVIGCYAQLKPEEIASIEGVDLVLGATEKFNLPNYLQTLNKKKSTEIHSCEVESADFFISSYSLGDRTRAFLKVQDGCDYTCSYCTIPLARGASRSDTIENVVAQAGEIASRGIKEIVLTGVNIGSPPAPQRGERVAANGEKHFFNMIKALDEAVLEVEPPFGGQGGCRFRISSIEPNLLTDEIIEFVSQSKRFVPHFHIPLQSGSDKVLKMMRRRYLRDLYKNRVEKIKSLMPHCCIGVDVIVGFPDETEQDFLETYKFINELNVSYLHVFTYSERENTDAVKIQNVIPIPERKRRNKMLRILSQKKLNAFYLENIGRSFTVLFEADEKEGMLHGYTENYIRVKTSFDPALVNQLVEVELSSIDEDGCVVVTLPETTLSALCS